MDAEIDKSPIMGNLLQEHVLLWYLASEARDLCESFIKTGRMDPKPFIEVCSTFETLEMNDHTSRAMTTGGETAGGNYAAVAQFWECVWQRVLRGETVENAFVEEKRADWEPDDETEQAGAEG